MTAARVSLRHSVKTPCIGVSKHRRLQALKTGHPAAGLSAVLLRRIVPFRVDLLRWYGHWRCRGLCGSNRCDRLSGRHARSSTCGLGRHTRSRGGDRRGSRNGWRLSRLRRAARKLRALRLEISVGAIQFRLLLQGSAQHGHARRFAGRRRFKACHRSFFAQRIDLRGERDARGIGLGGRDRRSLLRVDCAGRHHASVAGTASHEHRHQNYTCDCERASERRHGIHPWDEDRDRTRSRPN